MEWPRRLKVNVDASLVRPSVAIDRCRTVDHCQRAHRSLFPQPMAQKALTDPAAARHPRTTAAAENQMLRRPAPGAGSPLRLRFRTCTDLLDPARISHISSRIVTSSLHRALSPRRDDRDSA